MNQNSTALTLEELHTARSAIRVLRYLGVVLLAVATPLLVVAATPLVGWALLAAIVFSPLLLAYVLVVASRQAEAERRRTRT